MLYSTKEIIEQTFSTGIAAKTIIKEKWEVHREELKKAAGGISNHKDKTESGSGSTFDLPSFTRVYNTVPSTSPSPPQSSIVTGPGLWCRWRRRCHSSKEQSLSKRR